MPTMFVVSCRKDFWSATEFSTTDEIRELDLDTGHGPVITPAAFLEAMAHKRLTVLVHGYNNERRDILDAYRAIDAHMRLLGFLGAASPPYDALVGFAWPGGATGVSFPFARGRADDTAPRFGRLLADLRGCGATVDLNTHSLGAHVAFEALREASSQVVRNAWNFASAVDNESSRTPGALLRRLEAVGALLRLSLQERPRATGVVSPWRLSRFRHGARLFRAGGSARDH